MYHILPRHIKPQLASERSVADLAELPPVVIITHDGRYQLHRFRARKRGQPDAFQWVESGTNRSESDIVVGADQALRIASGKGWKVWAGTADEIRSLVQQWARSPRQAPNRDRRG